MKNKYTESRRVDSFNFLGESITPNLTSAKDERKNPNAVKSLVSDSLSDDAKFRN